MEIELKFKLKKGERGEAERILASRYPDAAASPQALTTTYYDTPDLAVAKAGLSLRVRQAGLDYVQTLKSAETVAGKIAGRQEDEWPLRHARPDFRRLNGTRLAGLRSQLAPLFVTDINRAAYDITLPSGAAIELAIDEGEIRAGDRRLAVRELEIELKSGPPSALYGFAATFHAALPLEIATESKASRGYRLASGRSPESAKAGPLSLEPGISLAHGVQAVFGHGLAHLVANLAAIDDIEGLHQMRVAIRRLRSALVLFAPHLAPHVAANFETALRRFGRVLGDARDWDVFIWEAIPNAERDGVDRVWLELLADRAERNRALARIAAKGLTAGGEFTGFILALAGWIENLGEVGGVGAPTLAQAAPAMLERLHLKAIKRGRQVARLNSEELHDLRKTLKKLRYGFEFLASLYEKKPAKPYRKACNALLEALGVINDCATVEVLLARLGEGDDLHLTPAVGLFADWSNRRREAALAALPEAWAAFEAARTPWA